MMIEVEVRDERQAQRLREIVDSGLLGEALLHTKLRHRDLPTYAKELIRRESPRNLEPAT
jgi:hypothetical protein